MKLIKQSKLLTFQVILSLIILNTQISFAQNKKINLKDWEGSYVGIGVANSSSKTEIRAFGTDMFGNGDHYALNNGTKDKNQDEIIFKIGHLEQLNNNILLGIELNKYSDINTRTLNTNTASNYFNTGGSTDRNTLKLKDIISLSGEYLNGNLDLTNTNTSNITSLQTIANNAMLRAINCNNWTPTTVYNIVWSNLTAQEQLEWKGLDPTTIDPIQSATGNYWNFTKNLVNTNKIGWYIPVDLSALTFQDLESFWAVIRFNTLTNISVEGSIYFSIYTNPATPPNYYRTRINYSNPATPMNQTGYFYKIHCLDTITTTTVANFGRCQEIGQTKFKLNPMNIRSDLWNIPFNKVLAPAGDTSAGYTSAPIQSISLHTSSSINNFNFDVVSIGYLDKQYNLFYS